MNAATGALVPDAVFLRDLLSNAKETFAALPAARVRLLAEAREHYKRALAFSSDGPTPKHARLFASLTTQLAAGTLTAGDVSAAERLFRAAAAVYRREKWDDLLGVTLMALKECYRRADARRAHLETCLELAALGAGNGAVLVSGHGAFDADAAAHAAQAAMREVGGAPDANVVEVGGGDAEGANGAIARSGASPGSGRPAPSPVSPRGSPRRSAGICLSKCPSRRSRWSSPSPRTRGGAPRRMTAPPAGCPGRR